MIGLEGTNLTNPLVYILESNVSSIENQHKTSQGTKMAAVSERRLANLTKETAHENALWS